MIRVAALLLAVTVLVPAPAGAGTETCQGLAATVVGPAGGTAEGTDGADVIVSAGATRVEARAGADTICVTEGPAAVDLGDESDVAAGDPPAHDSVVVASRVDVSVWSGALHHPNDDTLLLQDSPRAVVVLAGRPAGEVRAGADPLDELRVNSDSRVAWSMVSGKGLLTVGRNDPTVVAGFESVDLRLVPARAVTFTGRAAAETVLARACHGTLAGRRGDDVLRDVPRPACGPDASTVVDGGPGRDTCVATVRRRCER